MRFSIFTPTHDITHLVRLARSLLHQTHRDFEWVIFGNSGITSEDIYNTLECIGPALAGKIKVSHSNLDSLYKGQVGACKNQAAGECIGDILVEVDHDDELDCNCLSVLDDTFTRDPSLSFVYSDSINIRADGSSEVFGEEFGWRTFPHSMGQSLISFPPTPHSFSKVWFAPNHVRAWKKDFYHKIGGHDRSLDICDDHDLLCRTYIHGKVAHIDQCLYIYHLHDKNTCYGERNALIQERTLEIHDRYIEQLVRKWCELEGLDVIDLSKTNAYSYKEGSVGLVLANDVFHLCSPEVATSPVYKVLAPGGWLLTNTPSTDGRGAFQDPRTQSYWNSNSFWYYTKAEQAKYINTPVRFQLNRIRNYYPTQHHKDHNILYVGADLVKLDDSNDKLGPSRIPGLIEI